MVIYIKWLQDAKLVVFAHFVLARFYLDSNTGSTNCLFFCASWTLNPELHSFEVSVEGKLGAKLVALANGLGVLVSLL